MIGKRNRLRLLLINTSFRGSNLACAAGGMATLTKLACFSDLVTFVTAALADGNLGNFDWNLWSWGEQFSWLTCCLQPSVRREVMMYNVKYVKCQVRSQRSGFELCRDWFYEISENNDEVSPEDVDSKDHFGFAGCVFWGSSTFGPTGNSRCWDEVQGFSYATCCILASWNQHDANIPQLVLQNAAAKLNIHRLSGWVGRGYKVSILLVLAIFHRISTEISTKNCNASPTKVLLCTNFTRRLGCKVGAEGFVLS